MIVQLPNQKSALYQGRSVSSMLMGGVVKWRAGVDNPLAPYYGVGPGKIAIHLNPANAVVSGGLVSSVPNQGGAGTIFDATALAGVTRSGKYLVLGSGNNFRLNNPADIQGVRLFLPTYRTVAGQAYFMGATGSLIAAVRYVHSGTADTTIQFNASDGGVTPSAGAIPRGIGVWQLIETEITSTSTRVWHNGVEVAPGGGRSTPYPVQQIGRHPDMTSSPVWTGYIGDILGVTLGGESAEAIQTARTYLSGKYGITML